MVTTNRINPRFMYKQFNCLSCNYLITATRLYVFCRKCDAMYFPFFKSTNKGLKMTTKKTKPAKQETFPQKLKRLGFEIDNDDDNGIEVNKICKCDSEDGHCYCGDDNFDAHFDEEDNRYCCGVNDIGNFEYNGPKNLEKDTWKYLLSQYTPTIGLVTASHVSNNVVAEVFRELGWNETTFKNPNSKNTVSFFTCVMPAGLVVRRTRK